MRTAWSLAMLVVLSMGCDDVTGGGDYEPLFGDDSLIGAQSSIDIATSDSEPFIVSVPDGAASFAVVLSGLGSTQAQPATITSPSGEVVWEVGATPTNRSVAYPHVQTTVVPVNPDVDVEAGDWELVFFGTGSASATLDTIIRVDSSASSGTLDLNVHFVGVEVVDASTAPDDADFQAILDGVASTYSGAGISLGNIRYFDVNDEGLAVLTTTSLGTDELLTLLANHSVHDNRALNLFFVADIEDPSDSASLLGVAGGIPGPPALHGTRRSGVAVSMANYIAAVEADEDLAAAQAQIELTTAHEIGHYLGLFHTTERDGDGTDPLSDTPECGVDSDGDGNGILSSDECSGADGNNLMFWSPPDGASSLSSGQKHVLSRNPVVQ